MTDNKFTIDVRLSDNFNRVTQQVSEFETARIRAAQAQAQAEAVRQAELQKTQKIEMALQVLQRESAKRQAEATAEKLRVEQQYHMALGVLRREEERREEAAAAARSARAQEAVRIVDLVYKAEQQKLQAITTARTAAASVEHRLRNERLQAARTMLNEEARLEQRLAETRARWNSDPASRPSGHVSSFNSNMGGRHGRGVGWEFLGGQSFRTVGFQLRAIPGGGVAETLGRLTPLMDVMAELATGTSAAGAGVLGLTAGLVALGVAVGAAVNNVQRLTEFYHRLNEQTRRFQREARGRTDEDITLRLEELRLDLAARAGDLQRLTAEMDPARWRAVNATKGFGFLTLPFDNSGAGQAWARWEESIQARDKEAEAILAVNQEMLALNQTLLDGSNAAAEAVEQEKKLREERRASFFAGVETNIAAQGMTYEQRQAEIARLRKQRAQLVSSLGGVGFGDTTLARDLTNEVAAQVKEIDEQIAIYNGVMISQADITEQVNMDIAAAQRNIEFNLKLRGTTQSERADMLHEMRLEYDALEQLKAQYSGFTAITDELTERQAVLTEQMDALGRVVATTADIIQARIAAEQAVSIQTDMLFEEQTNLGESLERVREATEAYDAALVEHGERLTEIAVEAEEKRIEAVADAAEDFADAEAEAQEKREDQEKEHRDRIAEINRKADRAIANAIGNRDALAAYLAEQQRQDELADEAAKHKDQLEQIEEAYDDQKKAIQKRLDDQLESIKKAADKARQQEQKRYAEQARDLQMAIDKERSMVQLAEARLDQIRSGVQNGRVIKEYDHQMKLYNIAVAAQDAMVFRTQYWWNSMVSIIKVPGALATAGGSPGGGAGSARLSAAALDRRIDRRISMTLN